MKRLIHITNKDGLPGFSILKPDQIDNIINHSVDHLYIDCLESISEVTNTINAIIEKIRPEGLLTIVVTNSKHICRAYLNGLIKDKNFLELYSNKTCILSLNSIAETIQKSEVMSLLKIEYSDDQFNIAITSQRTKV